MLQLQPLLLTLSVATVTVIVHTLTLSVAAATVIVNKLTLDGWHLEAEL